MATLRNDQFRDSPLSVQLTLRPAPDAGWFSFTLRLFDDTACEHPVVTCSGAFSGSDYARLSDALEQISNGTRAAIDFVPDDPTCMVRARVLGNGDIEFIWIVDKGFVDTGVSTDTGVAIVLTVQPGQVRAFAEELASESSRILAS
jgi:hypothetical protein